MVFREVNEQNWAPEASAFFRSKTAGKTRQNRRKPSQKSVDVSGVQNRSFTSRKSIHLRFQHPQKMRAPTAPSFTKFHSAYLTRTAESLQNPGAPAGRVLAQNEFRTQRRPLNVAFVLRRTVEQATLCLARSPGPTSFKPQLRQRNTAEPAPAHARASAVEPNERVKRPRRDGALVTHNDAAANVDAHVAIDQARYAGTAMR